jgi:hypothetical protein
MSESSALVQPTKVRYGRTTSATSAATTGGKSRKKKAIWFFYLEFFNTKSNSNFP